jgi:hypothetical protein
METPRTTASLVIGGAGMLATATRWLAKRSAKTFLVARRASRFAAGNATIAPLDADWRAADFPARLTDLLAGAPPIDRALFWLHDPTSILPWLLPLVRNARTVIVLGSLDGSPQIPADATGVLTVRLGSKATATGRRWLTNAEISDGAIAALRQGRSQIVGDLTPP